jgi:hypothetical protein
MKNFKKGQKVWSVRGGWDTIAEVNEGYKYAITLSSGMEFTIEGKFFTGDLRPTLFHDEPKDWPDPEPSIEIGTPILVKIDGWWVVREFRGIYEGRVMTETGTYSVWTTFENYSQKSGK